jgi:lipopolysaccharide assembly outer membrane protein LptD (OstA)
VELKVRSKKDTITGTRKISIFDNLTISCGYNFAADSLRWKPLTISGRTALFSFLDVNFRLAFDPYILNEKGVKVNQTEAKVNKRAMRFDGSNLNIGVNWRLNRDFFKGKKQHNNAVDPTEPDLNSSGIPNTRPDFSNPWNITINYSFIYNTFNNFDYYRSDDVERKFKNDITQIISIMADVSITRKWKIDFRTGYDIQRKEISYTEINIYRDLHCWEMRFGWVPFGPRKGWKFQINVKAPVLQDLKYKMERDFRDNVYN